MSIARLGQDCRKRHRLRTFACAGILSLCGAACRDCPAQAMPPAVTGTWRIVRILPTGNVACWDEARARTLLGSTLSYSPHRMVWQSGPVPISEALTRTVRAAEYAADTRVTFAQLGVRGSATLEIDLQHEDADITGATTEVPGDTILLDGRGAIVVSACGVFYRAVRVAR